jgi:hypothetical protein
MEFISNTEAKLQEIVRLDVGGTLYKVITSLHVNGGSRSRLNFFPNIS